MYLKKHCRKSGQTKFESVQTLFEFEPVLKLFTHVTENALIFSQSETHNFFMYIITKFIIWQVFGLHHGFHVGFSFSPTVSMIYFISAFTNS